MCVYVCRGVLAWRSDTRATERLPCWQVHAHALVLVWCVCVCVCVCVCLLSRVHLLYVDLSQGVSTARHTHPQADLGERDGGKEHRVDACPTSGRVQVLHRACDAQHTSVDL
jgi:hypothetical protein